MQLGKNFKIWGVSYGVIGDLIMGLPVLTYLEKKFPGSYKYWVIEKKVEFTAPLFLNHPLIDCIRITGENDTFSQEDYEIASTCEFKCTMNNWSHDVADWYNYRDQIEETARIAGIYDLKDYLSNDEMYPKLYRWFENEYTGERYNRSIAIWPFAGRDAVELRSPSINWWEELIYKINQSGYFAEVFGGSREPALIGSVRNNTLSFIDQVRKALECKMSIGTDSGNMWVMGAYSHAAIHLMTNWLPGHNKNYNALRPYNKNSLTFFETGGINLIDQDLVMDAILGMMRA